MLSERILEALRASPTPLTYSELSAAVGQPANLLRAYMRGFLIRGLVVRGKRDGCWRRKAGKGGCQTRPVATWSLAPTESADPKLCQHCGRRKITRPRLLCWSCYHDPGVRSLYATYQRDRSDMGGDADEPTEEELDRMIIEEQRACLPKWWGRDSRVATQEV